VEVGEVDGRDDDGGRVGVELGFESVGAPEGVVVGPDDSGLVVGCEIEGFAEGTSDGGTEGVVVGVDIEG